MVKNFLEIDGSFGEGGGAILRLSSALSAITKKPFWIFNIRKRRKKPGLMLQHLLGIQNVSKLCQGFLEGDEIGSTEIKFYPGEIVAKDLYLKIETAGSITLLLQSLLPVAFFSPTPIKISFAGGGTDVPFSPTIDYFRFVFLKILEKMGAKVEIKVFKRGYYPAGGAKVEIRVSPSKLKPLNLTERGELKKIFIFSVASQSLKEKMVAERQAKSAEEIFKKLKLPIERKIEYSQTDCPGSSLCLICQFENTILGADGLGRLGKLAEDIGRETTLQLLEEEKSKVCLDRYLADQILPYLALTKTKSQIKVSQITNHTKTNIWLIQKFLEGKFEIKENLISWLPK